MWVAPSLSYTSSHISIYSIGLYVFSEYLLSSLSNVYSTMVGENFQIYSVQITEKCICESKILIFYPCPTPDKTFPQVLIISPRQTEMTHLPFRQLFFRKSISKKLNVYKRLRARSHCVKSVQIQSFSWSESGKIRTRKNSVFGHFSRPVPRGYMNSDKIQVKSSISQKSIVENWFKTKTKTSWSLIIWW